MKCELIEVVVGNFIVVFKVVDLLNEIIDKYYVLYIEFLKEFYELYRR